MPEKVDMEQYVKDALRTGSKGAIAGGSLHAWTLEPGVYVVRFSFGVELTRWDGDDWLRFGSEQDWNKDVVEVISRVSIDPLSGKLE